MLLSGEENAKAAAAANGKKVRVSGKKEKVSLLFQLLFPPSLHVITVINIILSPINEITVESAPCPDVNVRCRVLLNPCLTLRKTPTRTWTRKQRCVSTEKQRSA